VLRWAFEHGCPLNQDACEKVVFKYIDKYGYDDMYHWLTHY